jgi:hypothetical protein
VSDVEHEPVYAKLPWLANTPWEDPGSLGHPKTVIPGGPGPDADLPCVGRWAEFDRDVVTAEARRLCGDCAFNDWCFETALANRETGIWAGTTYDERRIMGSDARRDAA